MRALFKDNVVEALIGLVVVIVAVGFVSFAWDRTSAGRADDGYMLTARFSNVAGVAAGTDIRVSGIKVGQVSGQALDPVSYQAVLQFSLDPALKLPIDSSAAITSEGLLGGTYIALTPGGDPVTLKPGEEIAETSGATDLMGLIGSVVNRSGGDAQSADKPEAPAPAGQSK
ncbi:outer membrane lipid asymmetry maintenance protein MlaD [Sandarakinorhabdus sp.]|uniref:outer membrane lipid asymmetry maintenance protein MlaD n=1 Tax=Sandarakinorhabdus sp. TaxID=1916663 RepID=UPI00286E9791|nr:outer membrane lipid asymmetry maintenance protein MlaD [Sandarakinorhabdus sp.]